MMLNFGNKIETYLGRDGSRRRGRGRKHLHNGRGHVDFGSGSNHLHRYFRRGCYYYRGRRGDHKGRRRDHRRGEHDHWHHRGRGDHRYGHHRHRDNGTGGGSLTVAGGDHNGAVASVVIRRDLDDCTRLHQGTASQIRVDVVDIRYSGLELHREREMKFIAS